MKYIKRILRNFRDDASGVIAIEVVIILPALLMVTAAMAVFFDAYRARSVAEKASYTISDMLSRETNAIDDTYIDNTLNLFDALSKYGGDTSIRITVVTWNESETAFELDWSEARGEGFGALTDEQMEDLIEILPIMSDQDSIILVETNTVYVPRLNVGVGSQDMRTLVFSRPRYASQLVFAS